jgi:hypothetical protein
LRERFEDVFKNVRAFLLVQLGRIDGPLTQRKAQLQVDAWGRQGSTPALIECLLVEEEVERDFAIFRQKGVARIVPGRWIIEEIGVIHLDAFIAIVPEFWRVPLPLGIVMRDVTQLKLGVLTKGAPGELQGFDINLRKDALIDFRDRAKMISILPANEAARVTPFGSLEAETFLGDILRFGSNRAIFHREIGTVAQRAPVLAQMVTIGKEKELQRLHLV